MVQNQQLQNFLPLPRGMAHNSVIMVLLITACRICHLKDNFGYSINHFSIFHNLWVFCNFVVKDFDVCSRQLLLRYKIFWFLVEKKRLYNMHKKANYGDLLLFLRLNLEIRFFFFLIFFIHFNLLPSIYLYYFISKEDLQILTPLFLPVFVLLGGWGGGRA